MPTHLFSYNSLRKRIKPDGSGFTVAAGTSNVTSDTIDTLGYEAVLIQIGFGAITSGAVTSVKLQHSDDDSTYADVASSSQTVADTDDNKIVEIDVYRPLKRYLKTIISRATQNSVVDFENVTLYRGFQLAPAADSTIQGTKRLQGTSSGTA